MVAPCAGTLTFSRLKLYTPWFALSPLCYDD